jgi:hypothetical protein
MHKNIYHGNWLIRLEIEEGNVSGVANILTN